MIKTILQSICSFGGHSWIEKRLFEQNYIDVRRCRRCGTWNYEEYNET